MTDLRQAAQQALEALADLQGGCTDSDDGTAEALTVWCPEVITALRKALAQEHAMHELARLGQEIEREPSQWRDMIVATLVREGINKHRARELADHFAAQPEISKQTVEDVCMIARNAIDRIIELENNKLVRERNHD